jgi:hypothetical protein
MLLTGLRGVGKTVLLTTFAEIAESAGFQASVHEVTEGSDFPLIMARLTRKTLLAMSAPERRRDKLRRALGVLKAFSRAFRMGRKLALTWTRRWARRIPGIS